MPKVPYANEFRIFTSVQQEALEAIKSGSQEAIHWPMLEIEMLGERTAWPRLREAVADFLRLHAEHVPTPEARDARDLASLQREIEEANISLTAQHAMVMRINLGSVADIWQQTSCRSTRESAAAFLRKHAVHADFYNFAG